MADSNPSADMGTQFSLTKQMASLACLELTDEEVVLFTNQFGQILEYLALLQSVSLESPTNQDVGPLDFEHTLREDQVVPFASDPNKILKSATELMDNHFKIPL